MKFFKPLKFAGVVLVSGTIVSSASACSIHNHLCTHHALGTPRVDGYNVDDDKTRLVIFSKALSTSHGNDKTDFDNHVLLPIETTSFDVFGNPTEEPTGPYINSITTYGQHHESDVSEWAIPDQTEGVHVYSSQYQTIFNNNTAKAIHSGDLNGGEKGRTSYQDGCPKYENRANCEAVIITGNVPSGTYSQKVQMFNYHDKDNPSVDLVNGAWATGQGVIISDSHLDSGSSIPDINDAVNNGAYEQNYYTSLDGSKAQTAQIDYEFYNRGFDPHAVGTTSWDHNQQLHKRYSDPYIVANHKKGVYETKQNMQYHTTYDTRIVEGSGIFVDDPHSTAIRSRALLVGTRPIPQPKTVPSLAVSTAKSSSHLLKIGGYELNLLTGLWEKEGQPIQEKKKSTSSSSNISGINFKDALFKDKNGNVAVEAGKAQISIYAGKDGVAFKNDIKVIDLSVNSDGKNAISIEKGVGTNVSFEFTEDKTSIGNVEYDKKAKKLKLCDSLTGFCIKGDADDVLYNAFGTFSPNQRQINREGIQRSNAKTAEFLEAIWDVLVVPIPGREVRVKKTK